jgi:hypothetical protein
MGSMQLSQNQADSALRTPRKTVYVVTASDESLHFQTSASTARFPWGDAGDARVRTILCFTWNPRAAVGCPRWPRDVPSCAAPIGRAKRTKRLRRAASGAIRDVCAPHNAVIMYNLQRYNVYNGTREKTRETGVREAMRPRGRLDLDPVVQRRVCCCSPLPPGCLAQQFSRLG